MRSSFFVQRWTSEPWGIRKENLKHDDGSLRIWPDYVECSTFVWTLNRHPSRAKNVSYVMFDVPPHFFLIQEKAPAHDDA